MREYGTVAIAAISGARRTARGFYIRSSGGGLSRKEEVYAGLRGWPVVGNGI